MFPKLVSQDQIDREEREPLLLSINRYEAFMFLVVIILMEVATR